MIDTGDLFSQAMELPLPQRADLAQRLLLSLDPEDLCIGTVIPCWENHHPHTKEPLSEGEGDWAIELAARQELIRQGNYTAYDWQETIARMRQALDQRQAS